MGWYMLSLCLYFFYIFIYVLEQKSGLNLIVNNMNNKTPNKQLLNNYKNKRLNNPK